MRTILTVSMFALIAAAAAQAPPPVPELTEETFPTWRDHIAPSDEECAWEEIPWRDSFAA